MSSDATATQLQLENAEENEKERARIVRLRENKRRSRARQKEYVQQLERRCREYEQAHVQATVEMQAAARKVAGENRLLRSLLKNMGADDHIIESWLAGQGEVVEDSRTVPPIRSRRSRSISTVTSNGGQFAGEGQQFGDPRLDTTQLDQTHHSYPIIEDIPTPISPTNHSLLLQPMNQPLTQQPASPRQQTQQGLVFNAEQFSYSPLLTFTSTSSPTESTVASSPQISMDPNYHAFFPPSPNGQCAAAAAFSSTLNNIESPPQERKPLVFIRLDPTNDLYKLYPMSTIAIIPWLYSSVPQMNEQEAIQQQLSNLNVVGLSSSPSETNAGSIPFVSRSDFGNSLYSHHYQMKDEKHDSVDPGPSGSSGWM